MTLSLTLAAPQEPPPGGTSPEKRQLSGPGDSTSRSRSLTRVPGEPARLGGSLQATAMRSCPRSTTRVEPTVRVLSESTLNWCSIPVAGVALLIGGSAVATSSKMSRPADGYSIVLGEPIPLFLGQLARGRTEV